MFFSSREIKESPLKISGLECIRFQSSYCSTCICRVLAQGGTFLKGVAVASQILCISTTLNKRKASIHLFGYKLQLFPLFVKPFLLTNTENRQIFSLISGKPLHDVPVRLQLLRIVKRRQLCLPVFSHQRIG